MQTNKQTKVQTNKCNQTNANKIKANANKLTVNAKLIQRNANKQPAKKRTNKDNQPGELT